MTYYDVARLQADMDFMRRAAACRVGEVPNKEPTQWVNENSWELAGQPGFGDAYGYAILSGNEHPGSDPAVITDSQILAAVQYLMAQEVPDQGTP